MIKLCCFIQFAFDRVALVSQPGRKFGMLTWLGSDYYFFFHCQFVLLVYFFGHCNFLFHVIEIIQSY
jgi:hypothetical protein